MVDASNISTKIPHCSLRFFTRDTAKMLSKTAAYDVFRAREDAQRAAAEKRERAVGNALADAQRALNKVPTYLDKVATKIRMFCMRKRTGPFSHMLKHQRHLMTIGVCSELPNVINPIRELYSNLRFAP